MFLRDRWIIASVACLFCSAAPAVSRAQGTSTYWLHEQQRRQAIADQIGIQDYLRWQSGLPSRVYSGRPYSLESIYSGLAWTPGPAAPWKTDVFEPWPFVPGDIYGRHYDRVSPQPLGHVTTPLGPNGYTYAPLYSAPPYALPPAVRGLRPPPIATERPRPFAPPAAAAEEIPPPNGTELREF
jgi:hypothetical protein